MSGYPESRPPDATADDGDALAFRRSAAPSDALFSRDLSKEEITGVNVRITRPDGSEVCFEMTEDFREDQLCAVIDDELLRLENGNALVISFPRAQSYLSSSLRDRWKDGVSDSRKLRVHEVLGPTGDPRDLVVQLRSVQQRIHDGEQVELAIRSPEVARSARRKLRKLLLVSQNSPVRPLALFVHGSEQQQKAIMDQLVGMTRVQDVPEKGERMPAFRAPWVEPPDEEAEPPRRRKRRRKRKTVQQAVNTWIRRVEISREKDE